MALFKGIVQLTTEQFNELKTNGYIIIQGQTVEYDPVSTLYLTPQGSNITMDDQDNSAAIGNNSNALGENAVQLGAGTNTTPNTLQFLDLTVIDANGQIPNARLVNVWNAINNIHFDVDNTLSLSSENAVQNKVITAELNDKQGLLNNFQLEAVNSGITANDLSNLNSSVYNNTNDISNLQSEVMSLSGSMSSAQGDISSLRNDVSGLQTQIGDIDTLLTNLNSGGGV